MSVEKFIANALRIAQDDLEAARTLLALGNRNAIYLCEQAVEKLLNAVLISENTRAGVGHQLDEMVKLIPDANPLKLPLQELDDLAAYATAYR
jgi:HEPN domain-containing protein